MYLHKSSSELGVLRWNSFGQPTSTAVNFTSAEQQAVLTLIDQEIHNENALTDSLFYRRHPGRQHPLRGGPAFSESEKTEWILIRNHLIRSLLAAVPMKIPKRLCCLLAPIPSFVDPSNLGPHKVQGSETLGLLYTGRAGFIDLGHLRETCDITEFVWTRLQGAGGAPTIIPTFQGEATIIKQVPRDRWLIVSQAIANDDGLGHEIASYDISGPGAHNSAFSPEDLCSNFIGTVVARLAIAEAGIFSRKVDIKLASVLGWLRAQTPAETQKAFDKVKNRWVNFTGVGSLAQDDYLRRRNFTRRPFKVGHPSDSKTPLWVLASFRDAETFYTYKHTAGKIIPKTTFAAEIQRIRADAKARYGNQFDQP